MVLITTPPQPRSKLFAITFPLVPGGPDASMNGLSNSSLPLTVMARLGCMDTPERRTRIPRLRSREQRAQSRRADDQGHACGLVPGRDAVRQPVSGRADD